MQYVIREFLQLFQSLFLNKCKMTKLLELLSRKSFICLIIIMQYQSSSEYHFSSHQEESLDQYEKPKKQVIYKKSLNAGAWSEEQILKYACFININKSSMNSKSKRRVNKIFKEMSEFLTTRNPIQCRTYHQKQLKKFRNVSKIVTIYTQMYGQQKFQKSMDAFAMKKSQQLPLIPSPQNLNNLEPSKNEIKQKQGQNQTYFVGTQLDFFRQPSYFNFNGVDQNMPTFGENISLNNLVPFGLLPINNFPLWNLQYYNMYK